MVSKGEHLSKKHDLTSDLEKELRLVLERFEGPENLQRYRGAGGSAGSPARVMGLCIGVDNYADLICLANCGNDARLFARCLDAMPSAKARLVQDTATCKTGLEAAFGDFLESVRSGAPEVVLFSYAGHAFQVEVAPPCPIVSQRGDIEWRCILSFVIRVWNCCADTGLAFWGFVSAAERDGLPFAVRLPERLRN